MNPIKLIADYLDKAKSHIYGIFAFWVVMFNLPIIFTALFVNQELLYKKTGMLKNEYIRHTFLNVSDWKDWLWEVLGLMFAAGLTYLMIWVMPRTLIAPAYERELTDQYDREFKKLEKDGELEKKKQTIADKKLTTVNKLEDVAKKEVEVEQIEENQWKREFEKFDVSGLSRVLPLISEAIYSHKGHIGQYYVQGEGYQNPRIKQNDVAIAHSNGLVDLNTQSNTVSLTDKGKYFLSQNYFNKTLKEE